MSAPHCRCSRRARNAELWDADGRRVIDFAAGIAELNVGHSHPKAMAEAHVLLDFYTQSAFQVTAYQPHVALAERLNAIAPVEGRARAAASGSTCA